MLVKQWEYKDYRIVLDLHNGSYHSAIFAPGYLEELPYTPVVEMKHGEAAARAAAERFVDERLESTDPAT
jgi:hypothetical protein